MSKIEKIFSAPDVKHGLSLFRKDEIDAIEKLIIEHDGKYFIKCQIKDKYKVAKPEEIVRQLWIYRLLTEYGYPKKRIDVEKVIYFGSRIEPGAADIVVYHEDLTSYYILFEVKRPSRKEGLEALKSYCNAEGTPIGVWSNGNEMIKLHREEPNIFIEIPRIPKVSETLEDVLKERWNIIWLEKNDVLKEGRTTLKNIILTLEELVLGNAGVDPFEEIFKLIYAKLYDEWKAINDEKLEDAKNNFPEDLKKAYADPEYIRKLPDNHPLRNLYQLQFFVGGRSPKQVKEAISSLLEGAKREWPGVFEPTDKIELRDDHLKVCVSFLEKIKLFNSNLRIIDEAFEYLIPQVSKKKEGQFFTPRPVIDMIVKMLNPKADEFVIDPACGSAGFLLHSVMHVAGGIISGKPLPLHAQNFAQNKIYGIDFAKKAVKVAKAISLIIGDGKSHIYKDNSLAPHTWGEDTKSGLRGRLLRFPNNPEKDKENQDRFLFFDFDILMTNPPFAGTVREKEILRLYKLAERNGILVNEIDRHILFLERSLQFIKPGGRMAIILPQGLFNNRNSEHIRRFIIDEARILAVVGLHINTFKPHTGTKTSVLFLRKYTEEEKEKIQQIRAKYESEWEEFLKELKKKYQNLSWDSQLNEEEIPKELNSFLESYFESREEIEELSIEENKVEKIEEKENKGKKPLAILLHEKFELEEMLKEKEEELKSITATRKAKLKKEIKTLQSKINKLLKEIYQRTLAGQISLVLNEEKITEAFKKYWLDEKIMKEIDYPIFFGVNEKPVKDESGEYRYKRNPDGSFVLDEYGHPVIDHDLDEIANAFVKFGKEQLARGDNAFDFLME